MNIQNLTGQTLGQYELREILGFGGMGVAYLGFQRSLERKVAIKVLSAGLVSEPGYIDRFYREAKTAASLEHAHIVPVYDYGVQSDVSYVVMRLLTGGTLEQRISQRRDSSQPPPSLGEVSRLLGQLANALDYAHSRGIVHRDIKPSNVMFDEQGNAFIVDFGIAKMLESTTSYTASGAAMGTPLYMPPEQWRSEPLTPAADQYALAVTIYSLVTGGKLPFEATTPYGLLHKHLNEAPTPPQAHRADVPPAVSYALEKAMAKQPEDRYPTVTAFAQAFEEATRGYTGEMTGFFTAPVLVRKPHIPAAGSGPISDSQLVSITTTATPVYKSPVVWILAAGLIIVLGLLAYLLLSGGDEAKPTTLSDADIRASVQAEIETTMQAEAAQGTSTSAGADLTLDARVGIALTETATLWTATPSPDVSATAAVQTGTAAARTQAAEAASQTQAAQESRATGTAEAQAAAAAEQAQTATADAWTDTPTPTDTPSLTPEVTDTPTPPPPNARAVYTSEEFALVNISGGRLDVSQLRFVRETSGQTYAFTMTTWDESGQLDPPARMRDQGCYVILSLALTTPGFSRTDCPVRLSWVQVRPADYFWITSSDTGSFDVFLGDNPDPLATCPIAAGECEFFVP